MKTINDGSWFINKARRKVAGVCAGFASYYDQPVWLVRALVVLLALCFPVAVLVAYVAAAVFLPARWVI